jgi:uncharacterized membrane protein
MIVAVLEVADDFVYRLLFLLHILAVIVGYGGVVLNSLYGAQARKRRGDGSLAISEANLAVSAVAEKFIWAVPVLGILLVARSDGVYQLDDGWIVASIVLYVGGVAVGQTVLTPTRKRMIVLQREMAGGAPPEGHPPPQLTELRTLGQRMRAFGTVNRVLLVAILFLMIWKPGF